MRPAAGPVPPGVEMVRRTGPGGDYLFLLNHTDEAATVEVTGATLLGPLVTDGSVTVAAGDVAVIREHG